MTFAKKMLEVSKLLEDIGNEAILSVDTIEASKDLPLGQNVEFCIKRDIIKGHLKKQKKMTQFWFLIMKKMGFTLYLNRRICLLNPIPKMSYTVEIKEMQPIISYGDFRKLD
jgi:hypothetical protein